MVDAGRVQEAIKQSGESVKNFDSITAKGNEGKGKDKDKDDEETRFVTQLLATLAAVVASNALSETDRFDEAKAMSEKAERQSADLSKLLGGNPNIEFVRALALMERARVLSRDAATTADGKRLEAEAAELLRGLVAASAQETNFRPALSDALCDRAQTLLDAGNVTEAAAITDEAIAAVTQLDVPSSAAEAKKCLARAHAIRGRVSITAGEVAAAKDHFRRARDYYGAAIAAAPENKKLREEADEIERLLAE
jgi:hypothetical protein